DARRAKRSSQTPNHAEASVTDIDRGGQAAAAGITRPVAHAPGSAAAKPGSALAKPGSDAVHRQLSSPLRVSAAARNPWWQDRERRESVLAIGLSATAMLWLLGVIVLGLQ